MGKMKAKGIAVSLLLLMISNSVMFFTFDFGYAQDPDITFTSGERIQFTSTIEMTFKSPESMQFWSGVQMKFTSTIKIRFIELINGNGILEACDQIQVIDPPGFQLASCEWWEVVDPTGKPQGEFHVDGLMGPDIWHIDTVWPGPFPLPMPGDNIAVKKIDRIEPCQYYEVHWPSGWYPEPCTWWEIMDPETGELTGYEFHVDWTNESCEFHIDEVIPGPYILPFPWYEIWARQKIPWVEPCDYFVVEDPPHWYPEPCTWWEIMDPFTGEPTDFEFHVDWTNESCEFHVDGMYPGPYVLPEPGVPYLRAERKIENITSCDWYIVIDPEGFLPDPCTWWEILDSQGAPTGLEFHVDTTDGIMMFHVDGTIPEIILTIHPSYTVTVRKKIDNIQECDWFKVTDPSLTPLDCTWWEIIDTDTGEPSGWEFHVDSYDPVTGEFHVDNVILGPSEIAPSYMLTAEKKIDGINPCDWFEILDPPSFVPQPCSWWEITYPGTWAGVKFHVDSNDGDSKFHIDKIIPDPIPPTPIPPPFNVTATPSEEPPLPWYMKPPYPDYARSGMPDFDQRQGGSYLWMNPTGQWSHCGPVSVANSLWWLDSEFEPNTIGPPAIIDNYPLVKAYGAWDDHDPQNMPWLVEHLAYLMDTDGLRTGIAKLGTNVLDMEAGITHYLSWSGVNPLGDVDGDGKVTANDATIVNLAMGTVPGAPGWDIRADIFPVTTGYPPVADNVIDGQDLLLVTMNMGRNGTFYEHTVMAPMWDIIADEVEKCQDVVLLIAPWYYDDPMWYRLDEAAHFVTVAGLNRTNWEIVLSDPINDNAEAGGPGDVPVPHIHAGPTTHNNASLVSHDMYQVILDGCPGGPLTILGYPGSIVNPGVGWKWQIEAAVITSPYEVEKHDIAVTNLTSCYGSTILTQNFTYVVNTTVTNEGDFAEAFTLTLYWNNTNVINSTLVSLAIGETKVVQLDWNTTGLQRYMHYNISAYATPVPGETDIADNRFADPRTMYMTYPGDVMPLPTPDKKVDILDIASIAKLFGVIYPNPKYDPNKDIDCNGKIDIKDVAIAAKQFGYVEPP